MSKNNSKMMGHGSGVVEKAKDFKGTLKRLVKYLNNYKKSIILVFVAAILSALFSIVSPKILGQATTKIFDGVMLKAKGVPGGGIDFESIGRILIWLIILYMISSAFNYMQQ
ncbi:MAG: ABC transporter ATP-binding protein, partial [Paraclostridium sp.]